jgi:hypothetical protein
MTSFDLSLQHVAAQNQIANTIASEFFMVGRQLQSHKRGDSEQTTKFGQQRIELRDRRKTFMEEAARIQSAFIPKFDSEFQAIWLPYQQFEPVLGRDASLYLDTLLKNASPSDRVQFMNSLRNGLAG